MGAAEVLATAWITRKPFSDTSRTLGTVRHTADTPPIMKSTAHRCQVSTQIRPTRAPHDTTARAGSADAPKNSLGVLPFLTSAILTGGINRKEGRRLSGGGGRRCERKSVACGRLSTFSGSAGNFGLRVRPTRPARVSFCWPITSNAERPGTPACAVRPYELLALPSTESGISLSQRAVPVTRCRLVRPLHPARRTVQALSHHLFLLQRTQAHAGGGQRESYYIDDKTRNTDD